MKNISIIFFVIFGFVLKSFSQSNLISQDTLAYCNQDSAIIQLSNPFNLVTWNKQEFPGIVIGSKLTVRESGMYYILAADSTKGDTTICFNTTDVAPSTFINVPSGYIITDVLVGYYGTPVQNCNNPLPGSCNYDVKNDIKYGLIGKKSFQYFQGFHPDLCTGVVKTLFVKLRCMKYTQDSVYVKLLKKPTNYFQIRDSVTFSNNVVSYTLPILICDTSYIPFDTLNLSITSNNDVNSKVTKSGRLYRIKVFNTVSYYLGTSSLSDGAYSNIPSNPTQDISWRLNGMQYGPLSDFRPIPDGYNQSHEYNFYLIGNGRPFVFRANDCCLGDNSGQFKFVLSEVIINKECNLNYLWSNGNIGNTASLNPSNSQYVIYLSSGSNQCPIDTFSLIASTPCIANITINDTTICKGSSVTLNTSVINSSLNYSANWQSISSQIDFYTRIIKTNAGYYLCAAQSNSRLYKSNDLNGFLPFSSTLATHNLSFGKDKNGNLYYGTGYDGIFKSTDDGNTWTYNIAAGFGCGNLDFDYDSSNNLYTSVAGYLRGLFVSSDNGSSWQNTFSGIDFTDIECVPLINKTFIITNSYIGLSSNNGQSWSQISGQPFSGNPIMVKHVGNIVFVFTNNGNIYRSTDNATTWTLYSTFPIVTTPSIYLNDAVLESNGDWWIAIDQNGVFHSTNGGLNWSNENAGLSGGSHYLFKDNNSIVVTTSTGIFKKSFQVNSYLWSTGATTPSITVSPLVTTTYYCTVSDGVNTCRDSVKITVGATAVPTAPLAITGATDVCSYIGADTASVAVNYKCNKVSTASSYLWSVPAGVILLSGQGDTSINVRFSASFVSGAITVKSINVCGTSTAARSLTVYKRVAAAPAAIQKEFSPTSIVAVTNVTGLVSETYRIKKVLYATSYNWSMNQGTSATITHINTPGVNDTAVIVTFASCFLKDTLSVKAVTPCSISAAKTAILSANTTPTTVAGIGTAGGDFSVCIGTTKTFNAISSTPTTVQAPIASYRWTTPANAVITSATSDSSSITVSFNTGFIGGSLTAKAVTACGVIGTTATTATLQYLPPTPLSISSSTNSYNACINSTVTYTAIVGAPTTAQAPASVFRWTRPNNTSITAASADSSSITVRFNTGYVGGTLSVKGQSRCGTQGGSKSLALTHTGCAVGTKMSLPVTTTINSNSFEVSLYPNPSAGEFKLFVGVTPTKATKATVKVIDLQGRLIKSFECNANQATALGNELKPGVYMVEVRIGNEVKTLRAVRF